MFVELRQAEFLVRHVVDAPARLHCELEHAAECQAEGNGEAGAQVALPIAAGDGIDGQHHDPHTGGLGPRHHRVVQPAIPVKIELIDLRAEEFRADLLEADGPEGRDAEHGPELVGRVRHGTLALVMEQALEGGRRAVNRHRQLVAENRDRHIDLAEAGQHVRHEIAVLEGARVPAERRFIVGAAVDVIVDRPGQTPTRQFAEVMKVVAVLQTHGVRAHASQIKLTVRMRRSRRLRT